MPVMELVDLVKELDHWGPHEENTARLFEAQAFKLELDWVDRTTDPDDPEVKRDRAQAKRAGITPPPHPIVPPVALRPPSMAEDAIVAYVEKLEAHNTPPPSRASSRADFDKAHGFD